jgi:hypothetical protein
MARFGTRTPNNIVEIYRLAFTKMSTDPVFLKSGEIISDGFIPANYKMSKTIFGRPQTRRMKPSNIRRPLCGCRGMEVQ